MCNAKEELWEALGKKSSSFEGAKIRYRGQEKIFKQHELKELLRFLNFDYDSGYGSQYLFGFVLLSGGEWLERRQYDGLEWWEKKSRPSLD